MEGRVKVKEQGEKIEKLASNSEMHFNIILELAQGNQSQVSHYAGSRQMEEATVQQTALAVIEVSSVQGHALNEQPMEEGHTVHVFH